MIFDKSTKIQHELEGFYPMNVSELTDISDDFNIGYDVERDVFELNFEIKHANLTQKKELQKLNKKYEQVYGDEDEQEKRPLTKKQRKITSIWIFAMYFIGIGVGMLFMWHIDMGLIW